MALEVRVFDKSGSRLGVSAGLLVNLWLRVFWGVHSNLYIVAVFKNVFFVLRLVYGFGVRSNDSTDDGVPLLYSRPCTSAGKPRIVLFSAGA